MRVPKHTLLFLVLMFLIAHGHETCAQTGNFDAGLGPVLSDTLVAFAEKHADMARQHEDQGQYRSALGEYQQVIAYSADAARQNAGGLQKANAYYVLGLAEADYARMLRYLQVERLLSEEYLARLTSANQDLRTAAQLYQAQGAPTWPVYSALTVVQGMSGDLAGARASVQQLRLLRPQDPDVQAAAQQFAAPPTQVTRAAAALQKNPHAITPEQIDQVGNYARSITVATVKLTGLVVAGVKFIKVIAPLIR